MSSQVEGSGMVASTSNFWLSGRGNLRGADGDTKIEIDGAGRGIVLHLEAESRKNRVRREGLVRNEEEGARLCSAEPAPTAGIRSESPASLAA